MLMLDHNSSFSHTVLGRAAKNESDWRTPSCENEQYNSDKGFKSQIREKGDWLYYYVIWAF